MKYLLPLTALCVWSRELGGPRREDVLRFNLQMSGVLSSLELIILLLSDFFFFKVFKTYGIAIVGAVLEILLAPPLM